MTRILLFEAVSGGGLVSESLPGGSLLAEGLAMRSAIIRDLELAHHRRHSNTVVVQRLREWLPKMENGIQWLLPIDQRLAAGISSVALATSTPTFTAAGALDQNPLDLQAHIGNDLWDSQPLVQKCQSAVASWSIPEETNATPPSECRWFPIGNATECEATLMACAQDADLILIIAPEPELVGYLDRLSPWRDRMINVSLPVARLAGDKRNYSSDAITWSPKAANGTLPVSFPGVLSESTDWAIKPYDQCGAQSVWKLTLPDPIQTDAIGQNIMENWYRELKPADQVTGPLMVSPWHPGTSVSVSCLVTPESCTRFPACEQRLQLTPGPSQQRFKSWKVEYQGSRWAPPDVQEMVNQHWQTQLRELCQPHGLSTKDFHGWFGVDLLVDQRKLEVVDFNARWTSSYNLIRHLHELR